MSLTMEQIVSRLESIEADVETRQAKGEKAAEDFYRAKRDFELEFAKKYMNAKGSPTERKQAATEAMEKDPAYFALLESEGAYEGWKAVMRALEQRASIGQSLLRSQRELGG